MEWSPLFVVVCVLLAVNLILVGLVIGLVVYICTASKDKNNQESNQQVAQGYPSHIVVVEQKKKSHKISPEKTKPKKKNIGLLDRVDSFDKLGKCGEKHQYSPASPNYAKNDNPKIKLAGQGDPDRARFKDSPYQMTQLVLDPTHVNVEDIETNSLRAIASES